MIRKLLLSVAMLSGAGSGPAFAADESVASQAAALAARHREKVIAGLPAGAVAVFRSAPPANVEVDDVYRQDSDLYYVTGFPEPDAVAVFAPGSAAGNRYSLFVAPKNFAEEQWTGRRAGVDGAKAVYGAEAAHPAAEFWEKWADLQRGKTALYFSDGGDAAFRERLLSAWKAEDANSTMPRPVAALGPLVHELRLIKDEAEIARLRRASELSADAHIAAIKAAAPGRFEYEVKAEMVRTCMAGGATRMGYPPIVGSGPNSVILHYQDADRKMQAGEMIVNDTGCEYGMYTADVTRSYPVSGRFSAEQKAIYEIVLEAQKAGIAAARPGTAASEVYAATVRVVVDGLLRLGLLKGERDALIASRDFMRLYPHGSGHWVGMNVHDVGSYDRDPAMKERKDRYFAQRRKLEPGMALTVEPGIYVPEDPAYDKKWWNIGARIEDMILVTTAGPECLSCKAPREIADIEKLRTGRAR